MEEPGVEYEGVSDRGKTSVWKSQSSVLNFLVPEVPQARKLPLARLGPKAGAYKAR